MRILALGLDAAPERAGGGLTRYLRDLTRHVSSPDVEVVSLVTGNPCEAAAAVIVSGPPGDVLPIRLAKYWLATQRAKMNPDLIDVHFAPYAVLPLLIGRLRHTPYVVHFQGPWAAESGFAGDGRLKCKLKRCMEGRVYRKARHIVVLSQAFSDVLVGTYLVDPSRITIIPPGVDISLFSPGDRHAARRQLGLPQDGQVVVAVRRLVARVGLEVLVNAVASLKAEGQHLDLVIVGDGPQREALVAQAERVGVAGQVHFLGAVHDHTVVAAYQAADVCVVPTLAHEGFGLVVLESLACGTPVVGSDIDGLTEALHGLDPSLLVPPGSEQQLAARLRTGFDRSVPWPTMEECRRYAEGFAWPEVADRSRRIYDEALSVQRPSTAIRVVVLDHCGRLSGAELAMVRLVEALGERVDVHVILAEGGPLVPQLRRAGASVSVLPMRESTRALVRQRVTVRSMPWRDIATTAGYSIRLARYLRRLKPDLVQTSSLKADLYGGVAARLAHLPLLWHMHDRIADDYLPRSAVWLVRRAARWLPDQVMANSNATLSALALPPGKGVVVPYALAAGVEPSAERSGRPLRFGIVGRICAWKGQDIFLTAFAAAFGTGQERAVIVGAPLFGEASIECALRQQAVDLGIDDRVEFRGFRHDVNFELSRLDVLVHASTIPEPFGQVVTEGMAAGLAVVAVDAGGPAEIVTDGVDGLLSPIGDPAALAVLLRRLADDPELRLRLGLGASRRAEAFSGPRVAAQVVDVYAGLLARRRTG